LSEVNLTAEMTGIYAPASNEHEQWLAVQALRRQGERVVCGLSSATDNMNELQCDRQLVLLAGNYAVQSLNA